MSDAPQRKGGLTRKTPLQRKTPLKSGTKPMSSGKPLERKTPLRSGDKALGRTAAPRTGNGLAPGKGLERRTPLKATPPAATPRTESKRTEQRPTTKPRETRIKSVSKKRQSIMPERRTLVAAIKAIQPTCVIPGCWADTQDGHERKTRARGGSIVSPTNVVGTCRHHNEALTHEPAWGYETGLLLHSWDPEPEDPCQVLSPAQQAAVIRMRDEGWRPKSRSEADAWMGAWLAARIQEDVA